MRTPIARRGPTVVLAVLVAILAGATPWTAKPVPADVLSESFDAGGTDTRTDQALTPAVVSAPGFGQRLSVAVDGAVYAQPLIFNHTVFVATEADKVYAIDSATGAVKWSRAIGTPEPQTSVAASCADLTPQHGITSTPVIDSTTGTIYLSDRTWDGTNASSGTYQLHALDLVTGAERTGWPVTYAGTADNDTTAVFNPVLQMQRPGLQLMGGSVYAGFGSNCDIAPYKGWLIGVSTSTQKMHLWSAEAGSSDGGGIWQGGGTPVSDASGQFLLATGNGPIPAAGTTKAAIPATGLAQSVVRVVVQTDGSMKATDFFTPFDTTPDANADIGSGSPIVLPAALGVAGHPRLTIVGAKTGILYLLDRDNLGGRGTTSDNVVAKVDNKDQVFGHASFWTGDGPYIYMPATSAQLRAYQITNGVSGPQLTLAGTTPDFFYFGSGSPVLTSVGNTPGSAVVWVIDRASTSTLRAYRAVPDATQTLQLLWSASIGTAAKFSVPVPDGNRIYLGTADGHLLIFGPSAPTVSALSPTQGVTGGGNSVTITGGNFTGASAVNFGSTAATSFTVNGDTQITAVTPPMPLGTFDVTLTTPGGVSATSSADQFTFSSPPAAPTNVIATSGTRSVTVSWTAPNDPSITKYTVTPSTGGSSLPGTDAAAPATSAVITNLTYVTSYTFTVVAANAAGSSPPSAPSAAASPGCPCSLFSSASTPAVASEPDTSSIEVGVQFVATVDGTVTGVRFYKGSSNTGVHTGHLWAADRTLLGSVTFSGETANGWQQANFSSPIALHAGSRYVVSYFAPSGGYSGTVNGFASDVVNLPIKGLASASVPGGNGVYAYGATSIFPVASFNATNYWVDVVFNDTDTLGPTVTVSPPDGSTGVSLTAPITATFNEPIDTTTLSFTLKSAAGPVAATTSYNGSTLTASLTPSSGLTSGTTYTATVSASDTKGFAMSPQFWSFTPAGAGTCPCTIWSGTTPANPDSNDPNSIEVGVKFRSDVSGWVTGIRFYKAPANTGSHIGNLYSSTGSRLASGTFAAETASGWQQLNFTSPVQIAPATTYLASYFALNGHYSATTSGLTTAVNSPPLHALASGTDGLNGVYIYSAQTGFPTFSFQDTNYWVDIVFSTTAPPPDQNPPAVQSMSPTADASSVSIGTAVTATFSKSVNATTLTFSLSISGGSVVPATVTYDASTLTANLQPSSALAYGTSYTASISATGANGVAMTSPTTWLFTTVALNCPCTIWPATTTPTNPAANDPGPIEVGVKFRTDVSGWINGVRFYKGTGNTGTHVGNLWDSSGTLLATATITNETPSGWQEVTFSTPVAISANTTYIASYFAPAGHYAVASGGLTTSAGSGVVHALASGTNGLNGVYRYGPSSAFPAFSYNASNYWVDVDFTNTKPSTTPPTVTATSPVSNATGVPTISPITATFSSAMQPSSISFQLRDSRSNPVGGTTTWYTTSRTATFNAFNALQPNTSYTAAVSGNDVSGTAMASTYSWTFTTYSPSCPCHAFPSGAIPAIAPANDSAAVELGMKFKTDVNGYIRGIRFYKGAGNTGTHVGHLWGADGTLLATVTFSNETASGWQDATLSTPVAVTAGTVYVVSYFAPNGHYALTPTGFAAPLDAPPIHVPADGTQGANGVFVYGSSGGFPTSTYQASNYWVDVDFTVT